MNAFTPAEPAPPKTSTYDPATFNHAAFHELEPGVPDAQRYDGWTPEKQKRFLTALSRGHNVTQACAIVGMSRQTAYALRDSARGAAFALGWKAAQLRARDCLADELMDRAFNGVRESVTGDDGRITTRHRYDNQLAWKMLNRLDKRADAACTDADAAAVRLAAADFEQYLDLVEQSAAPGRAGLFLAARFGAAGVASEDDLAPIRTLARADRWLRTHVDDSAAVPATDLDPADRATWTDEQWRRAEAIGLVALASEAAPEEEADSPPETRDSCQVRLAFSDVHDGAVWWSDAHRGWRTDFPPPPGFDGYEEGELLVDDYERELTEEEEAAVTAADAVERAELIAAGHAAREAWLARARAAAGAPTNPPPPGGGGAQSATEGAEGKSPEAPPNSSPACPREGGEGGGPRREAAGWRGPEAREAGASGPLHQPAATACFASRLRCDDVPPAHRSSQLRPPPRAGED